MPIQVLFIDFGDTLFNHEEQKLFPNVLNFLQNSKLTRAIVSDFPKGTKVAEAEAEFIPRLESLGLLGHFTPFDKCVTTSAHAGVQKPNSAVFHKAMGRLGLTIPFQNCALITEDGKHISSVKSKLKMHGFQFKKDFQDWSQLQALINAKQA